MNEAETLLPQIIRFGVFELDLRSAELRKQGMRIRLPGQSFRVLEALLQRPGELVSREELQQKLWAAASFGDFEHGLNAAVNRMREALGDSAENPRFVETVPRRGYRFIAAVEPWAANGHRAVAASSAHSPATISEPAAGESPGAKGRTGWLLASLGVVLLGGAFLYAHLRPHFSQTAGNQSQEDVRVTPLTTLPGMEISPAFSPDGSQVVFAWDGGESNRAEPFDLYVKVVGAENVERLTRSPSAFLFPAWSPDGGNIAFVRASHTSFGIFMVPARGGAERKLADLTPGYKNALSLSWSPDGRNLVYGELGNLRILTPETGAVRDLRAPGGCKNAFSPVFSPDSATIAFNCYMDDAISDIYTIHADGRGAKYLCTLNTEAGPMTWSADGQRILLASNGDLLEISKDGGKPRRLLFAQDAFQPTISLRGGRLAYVKGYDNGYLWRVNLDPGGGPGKVLAPSTRQQRSPDISPDGKRIAFESERSGSEEVWAANLDGSDAVQLSNFHSLTGSPRWSPDGRRIVFDSRESGEAALYMVDLETAVPRRIPIKGHAASIPTWSADGKWIYFRAGRAQGEGLYRVSPQGGEPTMISATVGYNVQESKEGKFLYFTAGPPHYAEIHVKAGITGEEHPLAGMPKVYMPLEWALTQSGIFFIDRSLERPDIAFFEFARAQVTRRIPIEKTPAMWTGLAVSADGKWLTYSQVDEKASDLMLAEGFR